MTRVAWLFEFAELNGAERSLLATLEGMRRQGYSPVAIGPSEGPLSLQLQKRGVETVAFDVRDRQGQRRDRARLQQELASHLQSLQVDLVHANSLSMGRLSGTVVEGLKLPSIAHLRDILRLSRQAVVELNLHTRLLAVSNAVRHYHVDQGIDETKTHVVYNGVDLQRFCPRPPTGYLHQELGIPTEAMLFATIGQIGLRKGQDLLFEAFSRIARRHKTAHLIVVGRRHSQKEEAIQFEEDLRLRANSKALRGRVHVVGQREDIAEMLPELYALIHAARQEPLGRVLLEAAACGVPVIATNVGGTKEIFPSEESGGLLVADEDVDGLAFAWHRLIDERGLRERLSTGARSRACEQFDIAQAVENLAAHYRCVLGETG